MVFANDKNISLLKGDITAIGKIDVIVNAANEHLEPGSGVCGAIFKKVGTYIADECKRIGYCAPGEAVATKCDPSFAKYIIHTVGPKYYLDPKLAPGTLASCYRETIRLADSLGLKSIAFPCISTGIYGYPNQEAAEIAVDTVMAELKSYPEMKVAFVCYLAQDFEIYSRLLEGIAFKPVIP